jgi:DNA-binding Lrp family transcriptional regulator
MSRSVGSPKFSPPNRGPSARAQGARSPLGRQVERGNVEPPGQEPKALDFSILCERYQGGQGGLGFDPRLSPEVIARRLRVSPATVRRRFAEWRASGFMLGYDVLPHPGLLGGRLAARLIEFPDAVAQERAVGPLSLIDGVIQINPSRNTLMVVYFLESETQVGRRLLQLREVSGTGTVGSEMSFDFPPCTRRMTRSDWRMVRALRRTPEARLAALADEVGQSVRTASRRFNSLLDDGAIIFDPILNYSRFSETLAVVVAYLDSPEEAAQVRVAIRTLFTQSADSSGPTPLGSDGPVGSVQTLVCARTAAELDELTGRVAHIPGVRQALLWYERSNLPVREWLNERIESILRSSDPTGHVSR